MESEISACGTLIKQGFGKITVAGEAMKVVKKRAEKSYYDMASGKLFSLELLQQLISLRDQCRRELESGGSEKSPNP